VKNYVDTGAFLAIQAAGAAVLPQAESLARDYVAGFKERRDAILPVLRAQGFEPEMPEATMYLWVPLPEGVASAAFARRALEEAGVVTLAGSGIGPPVPRGAVRGPLPPAPAPIGRPDTTLGASPVAEGPHLIVEPQVGDGRLWVLARPALPSDVADALYGPQDRKDSVAVQRLRAMVDSLNQIISVEQRARRKPTWTTDVAGKTLGIDSQYIHIAGIKIPTAALT